MKKTLILACAVMLIPLASCDRWSEGDFKWVNNSSHTIEVAFKGRNHKTTFTLAPGQDTTIHDVTGSMSPQTIEEHFEGIHRSIIGDTFKLQYEDGKLLKYIYPNDTLKEFSVYNLNARNLSYILFDKGWQSHFIYTLIDGQYETAEDPRHIVLCQ